MGGLCWRQVIGAPWRARGRWGTDSGGRREGGVSQAGKAGGAGTGAGAVAGPPGPG